jgi:hypothetical protein
MKKTLLLPTLAAAALVMPSAALAHGGGHHDHGHRAFAAFRRDVKHVAAFKRDVKHVVVVHKTKTTVALDAKLSGTGTTFGAASASSSGSIAAGTLAGGAYTASVSTDWSKATTKTLKNGTVSCAPATATLTIASSTNSASSSLTGKTCSWTSNGKTAYAFIGTGAAAGTGTLESLTGTERVILGEDPSGAVHGTASAGSTGLELGHIAGTGHCHTH